jgi:hypothetical protein
MKKKIRAWIDKKVIEKGGSKMQKSVRAWL